MEETGRRYPSWILARSFGGISVAESPLTGKDELWPDGPVAPMAQEACDRLLNACSCEGENTLPCFVFLVGGAGNGKSKLAADVFRQTRGTLIGERKIFAQRVYDFDTPNGRGLKVVNDATIPPEETTDVPPLVNDVRASLSKGMNLLACVNRGVLVGETSMRDHSLSDSFTKRATGLVYCLLGLPEAQMMLDDWQVQDRGHYKFGLIKIEGVTKAVVHIVYMDQASLLEPWPEPAAQASSPLEPLASAALDQHPILSRAHDDGLIAAFASPVVASSRAFLKDREFHPLDPIAANALSLSSLPTANAWCSVLRGAEVISGNHFTYRELWALYVHSVLGPVTDTSLLALEHWVEEETKKAQVEDVRARALALVRLSALRTHMLMFDAGRGMSPLIGQDDFLWPETYSDALGATAQADPLRDFGPSDGEDYSDLLDRISGIDEGVLAGKQLAAEDRRIASYWTSFDSALEEAIASYVDPSAQLATFQERNVMLRWYGRYLFRLVALARGWPAHCSVVDMWQQAWRTARRGQSLPYELDHAIFGIFLPVNPNESESFFPALRSRVDGHSLRGPAILLGIRRDRFGLNTSIRGNSVVLRIGRGDAHSTQSAEAVLDFHLVREALARTGGFGFTDSLRLVEPRIERIRASLIAAFSSRESPQPRFRIEDAGEKINF